MQPSLFDAAPETPRPAAPPDQPARDFAVDPSEHVVLEASAGTGKTRVLVDRYVRLIREGVPPRQILAITFTRKAAAEMRERILQQLRDVEAPAILAEVQITTIDAFCFGLLREFPLEADVDPGFEIADETEMARLASEALDVSMRIARGLLPRQEPLRLLLTKVKPRSLRGALSRLLDARHLAEPAVDTFVQSRVGLRSADAVARTFTSRLAAACAGQEALVVDGPVASPEFPRLAIDLARLSDDPTLIPFADVPSLVRRFERYFLTKEKAPRKRLLSTIKAQHYASAAAKKRHEAAFSAAAPGVADALERLEQEVDGLLAVGLQVLLKITIREYQRLLDEHAVLDFAGMLDRSVRLLERQEEFARSRLKLESRYRHLLVDEFQDTSRQQWRLIDLLVAAWGEGEGVIDGPTSIFIVGDRKQSIYRFRHAEVRLLDEAARRISALRPGRRVRQAIQTNFRSVAGLLAFVNVLAESMQGEGTLEERFEYRDTDRFPILDVDAGGRREGEPVLGLIAQPSLAASAEAVATEVQRLLQGVVVRPRDGAPRRAIPDDVAILFRARAGHQVFQDALEQRGIQTYVYKGLGFFDAPEVQDLHALLRYLAQPDSDLRAAEFLRSRFVRLSDEALAMLAPSFAGALEGLTPVPDTLATADAQLLAQAVTATARWRSWADRMPASTLVDQVLRESAYVVELRRRRWSQARENIKKVRALIRRVENRGYATLGRLAGYFETLRAGDESHAIVEARGCVQLMTMHAAKGLEFPIVFLVNLQAAGRSRHQGISVITRGIDDAPEVAFRATEGTRLEDRREDEELRRLVYVAVTRARDRLYLAAELGDDGRIRRGARSLASFLPLGVQDLFAQAGAAPADQQELTWDVSGQSFPWRICRPAPGKAASDSEDRRPRLPSDREPRVWPVTVTTVAALTADAASAAPRSSRPVGGGDPARDRLVGTLAHRLVQWAGTRRPTPTEWDEAWQQVARPEMFVDVEDVEAVRVLALQAAASLCEDGRLAALLAGGRAWFEVPFSWRPPSAGSGGATVLVRGAIDCVVEAADGSLTVVEVKTGAPQPQHDAQVGVYVAALTALFPNRPIRGEVVYLPSKA